MGNEKGDSLRSGEEARIWSFRISHVWQEGIGLAEICYALTKQFPKEELLGMIAQIRRNAIAVPANVAQGYGRDSKDECVQFLMISQGSLKELESHLILSTRVGLLAEPEAQNALQRCERLEKMLDGLIRALQKF